MVHWKGVLAVIGGILVHISLGTIYSIGNITPYLISYLRKNTDQKNLTYADGTWIFALAIAAEASMSFGGLVEKKLGPRITTLIGAWIMSLGVVLTGIAVEVSFTFTVLMYGVAFGFGVGISYPLPLGCAMKWLPHRKGLVNGFVLAGFGSGAFIFNQIQTAYLNPGNIAPDSQSPTDPTEWYFTQDEVLDKVPNCFFLLGGIYAGMQLCGCLLLSYPPDEVCDIEEDEVLHDFTSGDVTLSAGRPTTELTSGENRALLDDSFSSTEGDEEITEESASVNPRVTRTMTGFHPLEMLKTKAFYYLWLILFFNSQVIVFLPTLYKAYGMTFIQDDQFLAVVGAFGSICNASGRIFWGHLMDKYSFRTTMLILCAGMIALMLTLIATASVHRAMFFIWIALIFFTFSGNFSLFPTITAKTFGQKYILINYGIVFSAMIVTAPVGALLSTTFKNILGWFGMFCLMAGFTFAGMVVTFLYDETPPLTTELNRRSSF